MTDRKLTPDEISAWKAVTRHITPLTPKAPAPSKPTFARARTEDDTNIAPPPASQRPRKNAAPQNVENQRRVRRGQQVFAATLDLHGHTLKSGWAVLPSFLRMHQSGGARCVLVITGKGKDGEGILRRTFLHWLETTEAGYYVSGYAQAHQRHGGAGAWYVYLRQNPRQATR